MNEGIFAQGYSDDLTILIRGKFESTLGDRMRYSWRIVEDWCRKNGLKVNPDQTHLVLFSRRCTCQELVGKFRLFDKDIVPGVKYIGVIIDCKLSWIEQVKDRAHKAVTAFWICRSAFGKNWCLPSKAILWIYEAVIRPMMSHGCVVWWPRLDVVCARKEMNEIQRLVCICATEAMKTTATAAMEMLIAIPTVQTFVQAKTFATADRLVQNEL